MQRYSLEEYQAVRLARAKERLKIDQIRRKNLEEKFVERKAVNSYLFELADLLQNLFNELNFCVNNNNLDRLKEVVDKNYDIIFAKFEEYGQKIK